MKNGKFPIRVKRGHITVKIYLTPSRGCESYTLVHYVGTQRQRKTFAALELAVTEAERIARKLSQGDLNALTLAKGDRLAYARRGEGVRPPGAPLELGGVQ